MTTSSATTTSTGAEIGVTPAEHLMLRGLAAAAMRKHAETVAVPAELMCRLLRQYHSMEACISEGLPQEPVCPKCGERVCGCVKFLESQLAVATQALVDQERKFKQEKDALCDDMDSVDDTLWKYKQLGYVLPVYRGHICDKSCQFQTDIRGMLFCSMSAQQLKRTEEGVHRCARCLKIMGDDD